MRTYEAARRTTGGVHNVAYKLQKLREKQAAAKLRKNTADVETEQEDDDEEMVVEQVENPRKKLRSFGKESGTRSRPRRGGSLSESNVSVDSGCGGGGGDGDEEGRGGQSSAGFPVEGPPPPSEDSALLKLLQRKNEEIQVLTKLLQEATEKKEVEVKRWKDEALGSKEKLGEVEKEAKRLNELVAKLRKALRECSNAKDAEKKRNEELLGKLREAEAVAEGCREYVEKVRREAEEQARLLGGGGI